MRRTVGVLVMEHIAVGLVEGAKVVGALNIYPQNRRRWTRCNRCPRKA